METDNKTMKYPNIEELIIWNYYGNATIAGCMGVTTGLIEAAFQGEEELAEDEIQKLSQLVSIPVGVLRQPETIYLDCNKYQHTVKVMDLERLFDFVKEVRGLQGKGDDFGIRNAKRWLDIFLQRFWNGSGSFCGYRAVLNKILWNMELYEMDLKVPRGLNRKSEF